MEQSKLHRYEWLKSSPTARDAEALLRYYGLTGKELKHLVDLAKGARKRDFFPGLRDEVPEWFAEYLILERDASEIRELALTTVPGILQQDEYARHVLKNGDVGADVEAQLDTRMQRQTALHRQPNPLRVWAVIHEGALYRVIGNRDIMREQLYHLIDMAQRRNITLQVIPNSQGAHASMTMNFHILKFDIAPHYGVGYMEHLSGALYRDDPTEVKKYEREFDSVIAAALPTEQSVQLIDRIANAHYE